MKVKNIMFSGFMAAVLAGACGAADAATVLASKEFVTTELGKKQDTLTAGAGIDITNNTVSAVFKGEDGTEVSMGELVSNVDELQQTVGTLPEGTEAKTIVEYVDAKTEGVNSTEAVTQLQNKVNAVEGKLADLPADTTVAEAIADAVKDKQDTLTFDDTPTENSTNPVTSGGVYTALSGKADAADIPTVPTNVSAFTNDANYVTSTELTNKGYQTAENVATAIGNANIAMEKVTGLSTALGEKAAASDVESLQTTVDGWTNAESGIAATYATKSELAGYATDDELSAVSTTASEAKATADAALPTETFNAYKDEMTSALNGKVDDADLNNYYTKTQADAQFLEDAGLANGSAYLVTKDASGNVVYSEVSVIGENGTTVIGKAQ